MKNNPAEMNSKSNGQNEAGKSKDKRRTDEQNRGELDGNHYYRNEPLSSQYCLKP